MKGVRSFQQNLPDTAIEAKFWVAIPLLQLQMVRPKQPYGKQPG